jgi:hypothetical protein
MTSQQLLFAFTIGTAALALWSYVRWPGVAPATMNGAILRVVLAVALLHVSLGGLKQGIEAVPSLAILLVVAVVVPVLTYSFLSSIWLMKVCVDQMRGAL